MRADRISTAGESPSACAAVRLEPLPGDGSTNYRFGGFELQPSERRLLMAGEPVALGPRAFDVLVALVERAGQLVTKEVLLELVWPKLVVEESNVQVQVSTLRKVIGPDAIATVPGRGYRFTLVPQRVTVESPSTPEVRKHNLPQQMTSFIGRGKEIAEIDALLARTRMLMLTGSGGCGKTRLALQVAADSVECFADGVWLVELAPLADPRLVPLTVATVLGLKEVAGKPIEETLSEYLEDKRLLLLLDNCEHLLAACATLTDAVLRLRPGVKILATSREALGIAGEQAYRVPSLSLPDPQQTHTLVSVAEFEAVQLFIDRASLARADFQCNDQNAATLASICYRLDGIPLAIELAAARVRSLSVEEINRKLDERFRLLTGGSRTALPRHQTLRSLIDWSYDLLNDSEKQLLNQLSVFVGGWALDAVEPVCTEDGVRGAPILDLLISLCDKCLVVVEERDGNSRYRLLETVRQYARERLLESGAGEPVRDRHRDYFLALAEEVAPRLKDAQQAAWMRLLELEHENLRASLDWSLTETGASGGLRLCTALRRFWMSRGHLAEGREWCLRFLRNAEAERTPERANTLTAASTLAFAQGDYTAARALAEESLALHRELRNRGGIATALMVLGTVANNQSDFASAQALLGESLAMQRHLGDEWGIAVALRNLGNVNHELGNYAAAKMLFAESLAIQQRFGDRMGVSNCLLNLGEVAYMEGDLTNARARYEESLAVARELGHTWGIATALHMLGLVAYEQGDYLAAGTLQRESLAMRLRRGERLGIGHSMLGLGAVVAALGDSLGAARIWAAAERLREEIGSPLPPSERPRYEGQVAAARAADNASFDRAWEEGRAMRLAQAIELALQPTFERS